MKNSLICLFIIVLTFEGHKACAQEFMFSGKVIDANSKPIAGAMVQVRGEDGLQMKTRTDNDGIYNAKMIKKGSYLVDVLWEGRDLKAGKVNFDPVPEVKIYYVLTVLNDKVTISKLTEQGFIEMNLRDRHDIERRPKR